MNAGLCAGGETGSLKGRFGLLNDWGLCIRRSGKGVSKSLTISLPLENRNTRFYVCPVLSKLTPIAFLEGGHRRVDLLTQGSSRPRGNLSLLEPVGSPGRIRKQQTLSVAVIWISQVDEEQPDPSTALHQPRLG